MVGGTFNEKEEQEIKILLVEDNDAFRTSFKENMRRVIRGIKFQEASNGMECLEKVDAFQPHLIFMDIRMPGENGLSLTKRIKAHVPDITIVILSSYDGMEYQVAAREAGASHFLSKEDLNLKEVEELINTLSLGSDNSATEKG